MHKIFTYVKSADKEFFSSIHFRNCGLVPFTNLFSIPKDNDYFRGSVIMKDSKIQVIFITKTNKNIFTMLN